ncbi:hypothetical protein DFJ77DRAFT_473705 [Powellomyces hirtus]|nr:hypothetical protein DFJ77DRAFT_473705 [Powellomyces hirtus]
MKSFLPILALAAVAPSVNALYSTRDAVIQITPKNFKDEVLNTEHAVIAEFFAPWCGHCKNLAPEYKKAAEKLKGLAKVVAVDCDDQQNQPICGQYDVKGFPTIKIFPGGVKGLPQDYNGPRNAKGLVEAVVAKITNHVSQIGGTGKRAVSYDAFLEKNELPRVIFASKKSSTPPLMKALSVEYHNRIHFGEVKSSEKDTLEKLNVTDFPAIMLFPKESTDPIVYEGKMKFAGLTEFFDKYAAPKPKRSSSSKDQKKPSKKEAPAKEAAPEVVEVKSQSNLDDCLSQSSFCVVSFLALEPDFEESVKDHAENLKLLDLAAKENLGFRFLWVSVFEHADSQKIMREFQMSDALPGMVAVHGPKKAYRVLTGPFDKDGVKAFLKEVAGAKGRFFRYETLPRLEKAPSHAKDEL